MRIEEARDVLLDIVREQAQQPMTTIRQATPIRHDAIMVTLVDDTAITYKVVDIGTNTDD